MSQREHFICAECGPHTASDEDGCCATCGADCVIEACQCHEQITAQLHANLEKCMKESLETPELLQQFDRLNGTSLFSKRSTIERIVDEATGRNEADMKRFFEFVRDYVWAPLQLGHVGVPKWLKP